MGAQKGCMGAKKGCMGAQRGCMGLSRVNCGLEKVTLGLRKVSECLNGLKIFTMSQRVMALSRQGAQEDHMGPFNGYFGI